MAHKSKKKHLKHMRQHQLEQDQDLTETKAKPPGTKAMSAALGAAHSHKVRLTSKAKAAVKANLAERRPAAKVTAKAIKATAKTKGLVRSIADAATEKLTAKPKQIIAKAKARVRSLLGREPARAAG